MPTKEEIDKILDDAKKCLDEYDKTGSIFRNNAFRFNTDKKDGVKDVDYGSGFVVNSYNNIPILTTPALKKDKCDLSDKRTRCSFCGKLHTRRSMKIMDTKYYSEDEIRESYTEYESFNGRYRCDACTKKLEEQYRKDRRKDLKGISGKDLINRVIQLEKDDMFDHGRNIMGCPEAYYDPRYLVYYAYYDKGKLNELRKMSADEVKQLLLVASKASEVFY